MTGPAACATQQSVGGVMKISCRNRSGQQGYSPDHRDRYNSATPLIVVSKPGDTRLDLCGRESRSIRR
jgi:hypothetical protein